MGCGGKCHYCLLMVLRLRTGLVRLGLRMMGDVVGTLVVAGLMKGFVPLNEQSMLMMGELILDLCLYDGYCLSGVKLS